MTHPMLPVLFCVIYFIIRRILHTFREVVWILNGTRLRMIQNRREEQYDRSAHVLTIFGRYRYDTVALSTRLSDFILHHDGFTSPEYVLKDEVTLYHINKYEAVFVQCENGDSPWKLDDHSFSRDGQFRKAKKVIILPLHAAHRLANKIGPPKGNLIFIGNIARCGSTLLSQIFEKTGQFTCYTEPGPISDLMDDTDTSDVLARERAVTTVSLLCKSSINKPQVEGHVVKVMATVTCVIPMLYTVFPDASYLFLYRDHMASIQSLASLIPMLPFANFQKFLDRWCPSLARRHAVYQKFARNNQEIDTFSLDSRTPNSFVITKILAPTLVYYQCLEMGVKIRAFRYEDITRSPENTLRTIFRVCDIRTDNISGALRALEVDSQAHSMMSKTNTAKRKRVVLTASDIDLVNEICVQNYVPNLLKCAVIDGTLAVDEP